MSDSVLMPALGESVTEGTVTRWLKQVGDQVEVDEPLLEVSTDKVDTEIPSPFAGTLTEILVQEDETVDVGTALATIGEAGSGGGDASGGQGATDSADAGDQQQAAQVPVEVDDSTPAEPAQDAQQAQQQTEPAEQPAQPEQPAAPADGGAQGGGAQGGGGGQDVTMPALGESVTEGTVTRWLKAVGDEVAVDEPLLEVSTDKVDTEIPSPFAGTLTEILVQEDETVDVGTALARIGGAGGGQAGGQDAPQAAPAPQGGEPDLGQGSTEAREASQAGADYGDPAVAETTAQAQAQGDELGDGQTSGGQQAGGQQAEQPAQGGDASSGEATPGSTGPVETAEAPAADPATGQPVAQQPTAPVSPPQPSAEAATNPAPGAAGDRAAQSVAPAGDASEPAGRPTSAGYLTPLVRKLAAEKGVDLAGLTGTGVGGRIRKEDVLEAAAEAERRRAAEEAERQRAAQAPAAAAPAASAPAASAPAAPPAVSPLRGTTEKASRLRQVIASRMVESLQSMAQLTTVVEVDVTRVARLRARAKGDFAAREGVNLTFLPFFVLAATEALKAHPKVNGVLEGNQITYHGEENVGIAVDTDRGLVVPVIRGAGDLNLAGIARKIADLASRTRANKVTPDELSGATFTVTNTGSGGALFDTPIVPGGTSAILGTGTIVKRPVVAKDEDGQEYVAIRSMCYLALSYDHRLVDGADAARYLQSVKKRIEDGDFAAEVGL